MEQKCTIKIGDKELDGVIDVEWKRIAPTQEEVDRLNEALRNLRTPCHDMMQRAMGRWTPPGPIVESALAPVIEDETRLIEQKASER